MIGLVQVGRQAYADRYTYFPSLGLGFVAALGLADAVGRARLPRPAVIVAGGAVFAVLGVATWRQTLVWRNSVALFEHAVAATGHNSFIRMLLAEEYIERNELERAEVMIQQAQFEGAPPAKIHEDMSAIYEREHREEDALHEIDLALAVEPNNPWMLVNRGLCLTNLRRDAEAVAVLQRAIALDRGRDPKLLDLARSTLATAQSRLGRSEEGVRQSPETGGVPAAPR
jgi:Tfp pilus assembly protein PilF